LEVNTSDPQNHKALDIKEKEKFESEASFIKNINRRKIVAKSKLPNLIVTYDSERAMNDGRKQVVIVVYIARVRVRFQTGVLVHPNDWDSDKLLVRKSHKEYSNLNLIIRDQLAKLTDILVNYKLQGINPTPERIRDDYEKPEYAFDFIEFMEKAILERKGEITASTMRQHQAILSKLKEYKGRILSTQLTEEFFIGYNRYLKTTLKNDQNTRHGNFKTIRSYINIAIRKKLLDKNPMDKNPVKRGAADRVFLTDDELKAMVELYRKNTLSVSRQRVLRYFLFSCFTGLRISDLRRIKLDDIIGDILVLIPYKTKNVTGKTVKIPLTTIAKQLIEDEGPYRVDGRIFNCIAEQNMREYIKLVAKDCKIPKAISFHSARHTFATVFLRKTNDLAALQKLLGHSNIRETMVYAHTLTDDIQEAMKMMEGY